MDRGEKVYQGFTSKRLILALLGAIAVSMSCIGCSGSTSSTSSRADTLEMTYELDRQYTGIATNNLNLVVVGDTNDRYEYSISNTSATASVEVDTYHTLKSGAVTLSYLTEGVYAADFKVRDTNGVPYIFEVLTWEYSTEAPDPPVISFSAAATKLSGVSLLISDSRATNTDAIWVSGDIDTTGKTLEDGGYWIELDEDTTAVSLTLTSGDGEKTIRAKLRNVFGNTSEISEAATIILKQIAPTDCSAEPLNTTIANNKLSLKLRATDPYQMYYSVSGSLGAPVTLKAFDDNETVYVYTDATPGSKTVNIYIEDIAGNRCLEDTLTITLDPNYVSEGINVSNATYWTDSENITIQVGFDHFESQEPLQIRVTGDLFGLGTSAWISYADAQALAVTLSPNTAGTKRIYAQYKDAAGNESYLIQKNIFLKPSVTLQDAGGGVKNVIVSQIQGTSSVTITGCTETYNEVAWSASYTCTPPFGANIAVTWKFPQGADLTKTAVP